MYDLNKFDPTDSNAAVDAVEDAIVLALSFMNYRSVSWPKDSSTSDGGLMSQCVAIIDKYADLEHVNIPELYRHRWKVQDTLIDSPIARPCLACDGTGVEKEKEVVHEH